MLGSARGFPFHIVYSLWPGFGPHQLAWICFIVIGIEFVKSGILITADEAPSSLGGTINEMYRVKRP